MKDHTQSEDIQQYSKISQKLGFDEGFSPPPHNNTARGLGFDHFSNSQFAPNSIVYDRPSGLAPKVV